MSDSKIRTLANSFRRKIDKAQRKELFVNTLLEEFPAQCCGITSSLLAEFLHSNGVKTLWISAEEFGTHETHAWLVVKDDRIDSPHPCFEDVPNNIIALFSAYAGGSSESIRKSSCYEEKSIENGLIIDITGDQFGEAPVYIGYMDGFHKRFDFVAAYEHEGLPSEEYSKLYEIIMAQ